MSRLSLAICFRVGQKSKEEKKQETSNKNVTESI